MKILVICVQSVFAVMTVGAASVACYFAWSVGSGTPWKWLIFALNGIGVMGSITCVVSAVRSPTVATPSSTDMESQ